MRCDKGKPPGCVFCGDAAAVFFDGQADKGDHADPDESFGEKGALNILPICIAPERQITRLSIKMMFSEQNNRKNRGKFFD